MEVSVKTNWSWIIKVIFKQRQRIIHIYNMFLPDIFTKLLELKICRFANPARSHAVFVLWMACNGRLVTKDKLHCFGMIDHVSCCFCTMKKRFNT